MRLVTQFQRFKDEFEPTLFREFVRQLEQVFAQIDIDKTLPEKTVTATTYTAQREDMLIICDTTSNNIEVTFSAITDNMIRDKREFEVTKPVAANTLTILPTGSDKIAETTSVVITDALTARKFRATTRGWMII